MRKTPKQSDLASAYEKIADGVLYGNFGVFVGAGLPMAIMNETGESLALSWPQLLEKCAEYYEIDFQELNTPGSSYPEIASKLCNIIAEKTNTSTLNAERELKQLISDLTSLYPTTERRSQYKAYFDVLNPKWIITTNYDTVIESVLTGTGHSLQPDDSLIAPEGMTPVFHLHGLRTNPGSIVITQEDYVSLFRPNDYRLQKLPLIIKESVTLLIGYGLGDFNVLTAVDWSKNVLKKTNTQYPNDLIQLVRCKNPRKTPYKRNGILIIEFWDLEECLDEICKFVQDRKAQSSILKKKLQKLDKKYADPSEKMIDDFISGTEVRANVLAHLSENKNAYINGYIELLSRALERVWSSARQTGRFYDYNNYLKIILDIFDAVEIDTIPPALMQTLCYGLDKVGYYIGPNRGDALAAHRTWLRRGPQINHLTLKELKNISETNPTYYNLKKLIAMLDS
ncbi:MAG: SIR2 family protein [Cyclobacteriaceae bacterium]